jgi:hypothetical protein
MSDFSNKNEKSLLHLLDADTQKLVENVKKAGDFATEQVKKYPMPSVSISFIVGFLMATPTGLNFLKEIYPKLGVSSLFNKSESPAAA